jgi:tetratricopeptide (TPR) repeat protein
LAKMTDETQQMRDRDAWEVLGEYLHRPAWLLTLLSLTTLVLYSGALSFEFVWDDWPQIVNSPMIRSWSNLSRAFGSDLWYHVARHQAYYRPLFVAWSMLNYSIFALRPWGWHLMAILAHVAAAASVFWLARKLGLEYWTAALAALIFALHPIHIEPVVWISAASDTIVAMFAALAFGAFLTGRDRRQTRRTLWRLASLALLACALLTKEMAVTFFVLVGIYAWLRPATEKLHVHRLLAAMGEAVPYLLVTIAYVLLRKHALLHLTGQFDQSRGLTDILRTLPFVTAFYLRKLLLPVGLTGLYYTPYITHFTNVQVLLPALALALSIIGLWHWNRREGQSTVAFAGIWMLVCLAPALYLRNFGDGDFVRDRYICLPSIGFSILLAMGLKRLPAVRGMRAQTVQAVAAFGLCAGYCLASLSQQVYWASDLLVLTRGQNLYPGNPYTMLGLAAEYSARGANDEAIRLTEEVAREHPEYGNVPLALAESYIRAGRLEEGRDWLNRALAASRDYAASETGMATLIGLYGRLGDFDRAFSYCDSVLTKEPELYTALYNCGNVHLMKGQYHQAEDLLGRAIAINPESAEPKYYLGRALLGDGKPTEAEAYLRAALREDSSVWTYHYWLGWSLEQNGNIDAARAEYQQALQLNQRSSEARARLGVLAAKQ